MSGFVPKLRSTEEGQVCLAVEVAGRQGFEPASIVARRRRARPSDDSVGNRGLVLANDGKGASPCRWPYHPPGIKRRAPALPLQGDAFERPRNRDRQCAPTDRAQHAAVGRETAPLSGEG